MVRRLGLLDHSGGSNSIVSYRVDCMKYLIDDSDFSDCISNCLNEDNENFRVYVKGIKLFQEYIQEKYDKDKRDTQEHEHQHIIPVEWITKPNMKKIYGFNIDGASVSKLRCVCGHEVTR